MLWSIWNFAGFFEIPFKGDRIIFSNCEYYETRDPELIDILREIPAIDVEVKEFESSQQDCEAVLKYIIRKGNKVKRYQLLSSKVLNCGSDGYDEVLNTLKEKGKIMISNEFNQKKEETIQLTEK